MNSKNVLQGILLAFVIGAAPAAFAQQTANKPPELVPFELNKAYIPIGFDDNDNVQVTVGGWFPDTCYRVGPTEAKVSLGEVIIRQLAYKYFGICGQMMVPFYQTVSLGIVKSGTYKVVDGDSGQLLGTLPVTVAKSSNPDDYLYAPVSDAVLTNAGPFGVTVTGAFTDSCVVFEKVAVKVFGNVIEVLPITQRLQSNNCHRGYFPFTETGYIEKPAPGMYLLHVRSLNGAAINKMVDIDFYGP